MQPPRETTLDKSLKFLLDVRRRPTGLTNIMQVALERVGEVGVVVFHGRLDSHTAPGIEAELVSLVDGGAKKLVFDLSGLEYISSAGLRVMLIVAKRLRPLGGRVVLCALPPPVHEIFEISGFLSIMTISDSREAAIATLN